MKSKRSFVKSHKERRPRKRHQFHYERYFTLDCHQHSLSTKQANSVEFASVGVFESGQ